MSVQPPSTGWLLFSPCGKAATGARYISIESDVSRDLSCSVDEALFVLSTWLVTGEHHQWVSRGGAGGTRRRNPARLPVVPDLFIRLCNMLMPYAGETGLNGGAADARVRALEKRVAEVFARDAGIAEGLRRAVAAISGICGPRPDVSESHTALLGAILTIRALPDWRDAEGE